MGDCGAEVGGCCSVRADDDGSTLGGCDEVRGGGRKARPLVRMLTWGWVRVMEDLLNNQRSLGLVVVGVGRSGGWGHGD
jgi:hypothetical protein